MTVEKFEASGKLTAKNNRRHYNRGQWNITNAEANPRFETILAIPIFKSALARSPLSLPFP